jgi:hypothetical protein
MPREPNEFRETTNGRDVKIDNLMSNLWCQALKRGSRFVSVANVKPGVAENCGNPAGGHSDRRFFRGGVHVSEPTATGHNE